jgi:hypothetical protein
MNKDNTKRHRWLTARTGLIGAACLVLVAIIALIAGKILLKPTNPSETTNGTSQPTTQQNHNLEQDALAAMQGYGLIPETASGLFDLAQPVSRAEFSSLLVAALAWEGQHAGYPSFADVLPDHPSYRAIEKTRGLFAGISTTPQPGQDMTLPTFNPEGNLTRADAVRIVAAALDLEATSQALAAAIQLPANDPIIVASSDPLLWSDATRLFYLVIASQLPTPTGTFAITGVH